MARNPIQIKLETLQSSLHDLEFLTMPRETHLALQRVNQSMNELGEEIRISQEQSRLAALYRVSQVLGETLDLDEVITQVMDSVIALTASNPLAHSAMMLISL